MIDLSRFPRVPLAHLPTPLESMDRLSEHLNGPKLYIKRDDCTGLATGGNKTRKLEFLMADAMNHSADTIITQGAVQSNHVRQTAAAAARLGLKCSVLFEERVDDVPQSYRNSGNVFLDKLFGAEMGFRPGGTDMDSAMQEVADNLKADGAKPYIIPGGGSNPIGALGYVDCARELTEQMSQQGVKATKLVHATGSTGTQAGLVAGLHIMHSNLEVFGVSVRQKEKPQIDKVHQLTLKTLEYMNAENDLPREQVRVNDQYVGDGYGLPTPGMVEAVTLTAQYEGILLDPVYVGKGMAGLIGMIRNNEFSADDIIVFLHTGGSAALFGYDWAFE